jgi:hypothetical protein
VLGGLHADRGGEEKCGIDDHGVCRWSVVAHGTYRYLDTPAIETATGLTCPDPWEVASRGSAWQAAKVVVGGEVVRVEGDRSEDSRT